MKTAHVLTVLGASAASAQVVVYGQCGGIGWTGSTTCASGSVCTVLNTYFYQCLPGSGGSPTTTSKPASTLSTTTVKTTSASKTTSSAGATSTSAGKVQFAGVNIAGFDFGCTTDGSCSQSSTNGPYGAIGGNNPDGPGQMQHFVNDDHMNIFRLPVGWQFLTKSVLGGQLDSTNFAQYNILVNACLATGAYCIVDIHNYARWNGGIIGQGGPTNAQFVNLWTQLATYYASQSRIVFGIMNEPHDLVIGTWAATVQAVVTAIRNTGAKSQLILLPGTQYTSAGAFISDGSAAALLPVTNPDGTTTGLIFDVHKYLDSDNSGGGSDCVTNNIADAFQPLAAWLNSVGRQAILSETGGPNTSNCATYLCQQIAYLNANSNVYLGYVGWSAGSFDKTYALVETPTKNGGSWTDQLLVSQCLKR